MRYLYKVYGFRPGTSMERASGSLNTWWTITQSSFSPTAPTWDQDNREVTNITNNNSIHLCLRTSVDFCWFFQLLPKKKKKKCNSSGWNLPHLSLNKPTGNRSFAIIARFELQVDGAWANVGNRHVGRRPRKLCGEGIIRRVKAEQKNK